MRRVKSAPDNLSSMAHRKVIPISRSAIPHMIIPKDETMKTVKDKLRDDVLNEISSGIAKNLDEDLFTTSTLVTTIFESLRSPNWDDLHVVFAKIIARIVIAHMTHTLVNTTVPMVAHSIHF